MKNNIFKKIFSKYRKKGYRITGENNKILIVEENGEIEQLKDNEKIGGLEISINGSNNTIKLHKPFISQNSVIQIGDINGIKNDNAYCEIGTTKEFANNYICVLFGKNQYLKIGNNIIMYNCKIPLDEHSHIEIGDDCMFAGDSVIRNSDGHCIYDINTGEVKNYSTSELIIGNHNWIGSNCMILKRARLGNNCVVASGSIVTKDFSEFDNSIICGSPASVKGSNISWAKKSPSYYVENNINPLTGKKR